MKIVGLFLALSLFMLGSDPAWAGSRDTLVTSSHVSGGYHVSDAKSFLVAHANWKKKKRWHRHGPRAHHWKKWRRHGPRGYHWKKWKRNHYRRAPYAYHFHSHDALDVAPLFLGLLFLHDLARH